MKDERIEQDIFCLFERIVSADFTDVAEHKKPSAKSINALGASIDPPRFSVRKKLFCPESLMINVSANRGNIYLRESA
jgi:hypothetical protein